MKSNKNSHSGFTHATTCIYVQVFSHQNTLKYETALCRLYASVQVHMHSADLLLCDAHVEDKMWKSDLSTLNGSSLSLLICLHQDEETWEEAKTWGHNRREEVTCQAQVTDRKFYDRILCFVSIMVKSHDHLSFSDT